MAKMMIFIAEQNKKKYMFRPILAIIRFSKLLVKESYINVSTSPRGLDIYIRLFNKKL